jgi:hypothetical protein
LADIFVACPRTGTPISTGLKTEWVVLNSLPRLAMPLRCPVCSQIHKWNPADAWIGPVRHPHDPSVQSDSRPVCLAGSTGDDKMDGE